ncbi:hypothetical protein I7X43_09195 [Inhella sp. 4Y17]|uniref:Primosomal protein N' (Replication factor Y)-superfamily II helicase n=1 Tax=Inhella gelatinilytica TaxID=2795030 RepID=A0A931IWU7_9BURK|nr:hypothetical protein [Inhella gelatinilytica]
MSCHQCGAQTELPAHQVQAPCPFCATPLRLGDAERRRLIRPSGQLPFALDAPAARERFRAWLRGLWFAPNALRRLVRDTEALQGVYLPAWTFDARAVVRYQGERGDRREARAGDPAHSVQQGHVMDWRAVGGHFELRLDDELIPASHSLPALGEGALQGVNLSALEPCSEALSAGFIVEAYQVDLPDAWARVQQVWAPRVEAEVRRDIGGDEQRITAVDCEYREPHYRHVLLPAWLASYRWNGRSWPVVVNGQTGRVEGARPWSIWKLGFAALALLGLLLLGWAEGV